MLKTVTIIATFLFLLLTKSGFSQAGKDTLIMLNGGVMIGTVIDTLNGVTTLKNPKDSTKNILIENDRIFSITNASGESILYVYDTVIGNEFTVDEMRYFIIGEQDAEKGFKAKGAFWGNMVVGAASGVTLGFFSPLPVFAFTAASGLPRINIKHKTVTNTECLKHDTYLMGYERVARKKRKISSLVGGVIGLAVGVGTSAVLQANGASIKFK